MLKIYDKDELLKKVKMYNQIVCFGKGKNFEELQLIFKNTSLLEKINYIVDNNKKKQGTDVFIEDKKLNIISLSELKRKSLKNFGILITPAIYSEIIRQIEEDDELKDIDYFCLMHIMAFERERSVLKVKVPDNIKLYQKPIIPKIIHYCWFGEKPIPDKYKSWMESWSKFCPDYKIIQWNEKNYDISKNKYMYQAYKEKMWAFVPDYARLDIIYNYGGIYLDTDVELLQSLDDLLYQKGFAGFETNDYVAFGLGFGAIKGLSIIKEMRDEYENLDFFYYKKEFGIVASPYWQTKVLKKHGLCTNGEYQIIADMVIYPVKVFNGRSIIRRSPSDFYPKSIHHYEASSWQEERVKERLLTFDKDMENYCSNQGKSNDL